jgi:hypothetical protein
MSIFDFLFEDNTDKENKEIENIIRYNNYVIHQDEDVVDGNWLMYGGLYYPTLILMDEKEYITIFTDCKWCIEGIIKEKALEFLKHIKQLNLEYEKQSKERSILFETERKEKEQKAIKYFENKLSE